MQNLIKALDLLERDYSLALKRRSLAESAYNKEARKLQPLRNELTAADEQVTRLKDAIDSIRYLIGDDDDEVE